MINAVIMNKEKNFISAVVYVHNNEKYVANFLQMLITVLEKNFEHAEIICVNDFSTDDSVKIIKSFRNNTSIIALSVLNLSYFHGIELAMNAGVDLSIGDFVIEFDTVSFDYSSGEIMCVYNRVLEGYDIVSATPIKKQKFSSRVFYWLYEMFSNKGEKKHIKLSSETFRILSRRAINRVSAMNKTIPYRKAIYANCGLKIDSLCYEPTALTSDKTLENESFYRQQLAINTLLLFTDAGYVCAKFMTLLMSVISMFMLVYTVVIYITSKPVVGWTTTMLFLSLGFLGMFLILTIIIKYLQLLLDIIFKKTRYTYESIEKLTK